MRIIRRNPKLTFEEVKEKLDNLGIKLYNNEEWDCYEVYPMYGLRENDPLHQYTQDRSEESLEEAFKKGLQMAKKLGKFSKITFDRSKKIIRRNPEDVLELYQKTTSKDKKEARKAALKLKYYFSNHSKMIDYWPIIRVYSNLDKDDINFVIGKILRETSGVRQNPIKQVVKKKTPVKRKVVKRSK